MEAHVMPHVWPKICHVCLVEHEVERCKRRVVLLVLESGGHDTACGQGEARGRPRSFGGSAGSRKIVAKTAAEVLKSRLTFLRRRESRIFFTL